MALLGTYIDTQTVSVAATASLTVTHSLAASPDIVLAMASYQTVSLATSIPYFTVQWGSASITMFNQGKSDYVGTVVAIRAHSIIK